MIRIIEQNADMDPDPHYNRCGSETLPMAGVSYPGLVSHPRLAQMPVLLSLYVVGLVLPCLPFSSEGKFLETNFFLGAPLKKLI